MCKKREIACICFVSLIALFVGASMAHADLIGHWKLDDNAATPTVLEEVAGLNGTMSVNTDTVSGPGVDGASLDFANTHSVTIDNPAPLLGISEFTVSAWVQNPIYLTDPEHPWGEQLFSWTNGTHGERLSLELYNFGLAAYSDGASFSGNSVVSEALTWVADTWYHVAWTQSGGTMEMYRDGVLLSKVQNPTDRPVPSQLALTQLEIGNLMGGDNYNGNMDDVQLYNEQLSAEQIAVLHANPGSPIPEPGTLLLAASGLISLLIWRRRN